MVRKVFKLFNKSSRYQEVFSNFPKQLMCIYWDTDPPREHDCLHVGSDGRLHLILVCTPHEWVDSRLEQKTNFCIAQKSGWNELCVKLLHSVLSQLLVVNGYLSHPSKQKSIEELILIRSNTVWIIFMFNTEKQVTEINPACKNI